MDRFRHIFGDRMPFIAMIHLKALPGTPAYDGNWRAIVEQAVEEAKQLRDWGADALLIENMHDTPYLRREVGPEITASITRAVVEIRRAAPELPCGLQVLAGANKAALAIALAADLEFIRAEGFVFGHLADEGWMDADAGTLLRYRRQIGAEKVAIFTDIKKKHSAHAASADVNLAETAKAARFFRSDGVIVTGAATGATTAQTDLSTVREAVPELPVLVGSGVTPKQIAHLFPFVNGVIVGSYLKEGGRWDRALSQERVQQIVKAVREASSQ